MDASKYVIGLNFIIVTVLLLVWDEYAIYLDNVALAYHLFSAVTFFFSRQYKLNVKMNISNKTLETLNITTTPDPIIDERLLFEICKWTNLFIVILGLVTNTLIIIVLSRSRIGSKYLLTIL